jgi:hypothetical protein
MELDGLEKVEHPGLVDGVSLEGEGVAAAA